MGRWLSGCPLDLSPDKDDPAIAADPQCRNTAVQLWALGVVIVAPTGSTVLLHGEPGAGQTMPHEAAGAASPARAFQKCVNEYLGLEYLVSSSLCNV
jgi:hypothetical protein